MYRGDNAYAETRLVGTIVRIKRMPVTVEQVRSNGMVSCRTLRRGRQKEIHIDKLNLEPIKFGYCNAKGAAHYVMRLPMRRDWKQGARYSNLHIKDGDVRELPWTDIMQCINNDYPNLSECFAMLKHGMRSMAWCKLWAINSDYRLLYKGEKVGKVNSDGGLALYDGFKHLQECLDEYT